MLLQNSLEFNKFYGEIHHAGSKGLLQHSINSIHCHTGFKGEQEVEMRGTLIFNTWGHEAFINQRVEEVFSHLAQTYGKNLFLHKRSAEHYVLHINYAWIEVINKNY
jgi:hypothetical protein